MKTIKMFEDLEIWQFSKSICVEFYSICNIKPISYDYGIRDQIRRSAVSISSNIAEGFEYDNNKDLMRFLRYAKGSTVELRNQLIILFETKMVSQDFYLEMNAKLMLLSRKTATLINYLKKYENDKNHSK